jgi:hypothetical protein
MKRRSWGIYDGPGCLDSFRGRITDIGLTGFALRGERIEFLLEPSSEDLRV